MKEEPLRIYLDPSVFFQVTSSRKPAAVMGGGRDSIYSQSYIWIELGCLIFNAHISLPEVALARTQTTCHSSVISLDQVIYVLLSDPNRHDPYVLHYSNMATTVFARPRQDVRHDSC